MSRTSLIFKCEVIAEPMNLGRRRFRSSSRPLRDPLVSFDFKPAARRSGSTGTLFTRRSRKQWSDSRSGCSHAPGTVWKSGRNSARAFPLLSYRVFDRLDGDDYDPVIVSVTVTLDGSLARSQAISRGMSPGASTSMKDARSKLPQIRQTSSGPPHDRGTSCRPRRLSLILSGTVTSRSLHAESASPWTWGMAHARGKRERYIH